MRRSRNELEHEKVLQMRSLSHEIAIVLTDLSLQPSIEGMIRLNGLWARLMRLTYGPTMKPEGTPLDPT
jgi:hypothetical protein